MTEWRNGANFGFPLLKELAFEFTPYLYTNRAYYKLWSLLKLESYGLEVFTLNHVVLIQFYVNCLKESLPPIHCGAVWVDFTGACQDR